jgi:hypothetical protein
MQPKSISFFVLVATHFSWESNNKIGIDETFMNLFWVSINFFSNFIYDTLSSRASISMCTTSSKVVDFSWRRYVLHKSGDTV